MSLRTFIFCDVCNKRAIRNIDDRRGDRRNKSSGRRNSDNRAWYEGSAEEAIQAGWTVKSQDNHICPRCTQRGHN